MKLSFTGYNQLGSQGFFQDLSNYDSLKSWLEAICNQTSHFHPNDCAILDEDKNQTHWIVQSGRIHPQAEHHIQAAQQELQNSPNTQKGEQKMNQIRVEADGDKQELYIHIV